jgi:subtilase family serine protease
MILMITLGVTARANAQQTALIAGNHSPSVALLHATHPAPAEQQLQMSIALRPSNQTGLDALLAAQQNPASPNYHQWLKPGEFDQRFAPDAATRAAIVKWLSGAGFSVASSGDVWTIKFSGAVAQAEHAFAVAIDSPDDGAYFANLTDPSVPAQYVSAIGNIDGLDNLRAGRNPMHFVPGSEAATGVAAPEVTLNGKTGFGPSDFYTFYDENPLLKAGINGSGGGCIGLIEISDYPDAAVESFDKTFKLAAAQLTRVVATDSSNPNFNDREDETMLDILYSHSFAPGAPISVYLASPATNSNNVIFATVDALNQAVNDDKCTALSISIESCGFPPSYYTGALHTTYMKAASQGQTVFVAEGDEGAAEFSVDTMTGQCVVGTSRNVNELASDPNVTAIGGTQFTPDYSHGKDVGFVPESVWNEPQFLPQGIGSGGGGASVVFTKPSFQSTGTPADGARDVPDISIEAACVTPGAFSVFPDQPSGDKVECCACGTSIGAPMWAGITEMLNQSDGGQSVGPINTRLYTLGNLQDTAKTGIRDVTMGNNDYNGVTGFDAVPGYDQASGWGTPDITTFVSAYLEATTVPVTLTLAPTALNFGTSTLEGSSSKPRKITIKNVTKGRLVAISGQSTNDPSFEVSEQCDTTLLPEKSCIAEVIFHPTDLATHAAELMINDNAQGTPQMVSLMGKAKAPK